MAYIRSTVYMLFLIITVIPFALASVLLAPIPQPIRYRVTIGWPKLALWGSRTILGIRLNILGEDNLPDGPAILLSKHQSALETVYFPARMPRQVCFVYKKELHRVPFFGWGLALLDMIPINRAKGKEAFEQVVRIGSQRLQEGRWPVLFPEGTRMAPGKTGRYRMGGARLAAHTGVPVIPIAHNAGTCWPRNAFLKKPGTVTISFGPPIATEGLDPATINQLVQDWIEGEMRRIAPEQYGQNSST